MRLAFGETLMKLADKDERIVLLTGDVEQEMEPFKEKYPDRFFNLASICFLKNASFFFEYFFAAISHFLVYIFFNVIKYFLPFNSMGSITFSKALRPAKSSKF